MNDQLKKDITDWQTKADLYGIKDNGDQPGNIDPDEIIHLFEEARTLLLRASLSI